jgi:hypothetical protein
MATFYDIYQYYLNNPNAIPGGISSVSGVSGVAPVATPTSSQGIMSAVPQGSLVENGSGDNFSQIGTAPTSSSGTSIGNAISNAMSSIGSMSTGRAIGTAIGYGLGLGPIGTFGLGQIGSSFGGGTTAGPGGVDQGTGPGGCDTGVDQGVGPGGCATGTSTDQGVGPGGCATGTSGPGPGPGPGPDSGTGPGGCDSGPGPGPGPGPDSGTGPGGCSNGGGSDGGGGTYVCTASYANNLITPLDFRTLKQYGIKLRKNDKYLMKAYDWFGPKLASAVKKGKLINFAKHSTSMWKYDQTKQKDVSFKIKLMITFHKLITRPIVRTLGVFLTIKEKITK